MINVASLGGITIPNQGIELRTTHKSALIATRLLTVTEPDIVFIVRALVTTKQGAKEE